MPAEISTRLGLTSPQLVEVETVQAQAQAYGAAAFRVFDELLCGHILAHEPVEMGGPRTDAAIFNSCEMAAKQTAEGVPGLLWPVRAVAGAPALSAGAIEQEHALLGVDQTVGSPTMTLPA